MVTEVLVNRETLDEGIKRMFEDLKERARELWTMNKREALIEYRWIVSVHRHEEDTCILIRTIWK